MCTSHFLSFKSPVGMLTLFSEEGHIVALEWGQAPDGHTSPVLEEARDQLEAYFRGTLKQFDLPLRPKGTTFQKSVWNLMLEIPYGNTRTYADLARDLKSAARAVGGACGKNPIAIIIPCHRIVATGSLGGFSGGEGVNSKLSLLRLEGVPC